MSQRILEVDLQLPALYLIRFRNGKINTSELSNLLRDILKPKGEDLVILASRPDDKFSQIVRNLTAKERSFVKNGFIDRASIPNSPLFITPKGESYLNENIELVEYLFTNDFDFDDTIKSLKNLQVANKKAQIFDENITISEGVKKIANVAVYERSKKLREYALNYFTVEERISCNCCTFNFGDFYGEEIGKGFIEIHHTKPIFQYENEDIENTLQQAVTNLTPVCSNCHRMIHRNWKKPIEIQHLINNINANGIFARN